MKRQIITGLLGIFAVVIAATGILPYFTQTASAASTTSLTVALSVTFDKTDSSLQPNIPTLTLTSPNVQTANGITQGYSQSKTPSSATPKKLTSKKITYSGVTFTGVSQNSKYLLCANANFFTNGAACQNLSTGSGSQQNFTFNTTAKTSAIPSAANTGVGSGQAQCTAGFTACAFDGADHTCSAISGPVDTQNYYLCGTGTVLTNCSTTTRICTKMIELGSTTCTGGNQTGVYTLDSSKGSSFSCNTNNGTTDTSECTDGTPKDFTKYPDTGCADSGIIGSTCTDGDSTGTTDANGNCDSDSDSLDCGAGDWNWLVCSGITLLQGAATKMNNLINHYLTVDTNEIFSSDSGQSGYHTAWNSFRVLATAILLIAGLIMVASEALGLEILDAYTIRKTLPRLLVGAIGISLSWPIMQFVIDFFNVFGRDIMNLIAVPFNSLENHQEATIITMANPLTVLLVAGGALFVYGPVALTFVLTALLAILLAIIVLVIRQAAIIVLVVLAPVAIACYILPNTQRIWKLWYDNFLGLMMMYPIIMAFIAGGRVMSAAAGSHQDDPFYGFLSLIAYFIPYFLLPLAFRMATGAIGTIAGMVNDRHKGAFDRLKNMRNAGRQMQHQRRMNEELSPGRLGNIYRRTATGLTVPGSGAFSPTKRGRTNYADYRRKLLEGRSAEALKNDNGRAAGMDEATALAVQGMGRSQFLQAYQNAGHSKEEANTALATLERGFGARMGSSAMRVAAFKARSASSTAYSGDEAGTMQRINEGAALLNAGLMTDADLVAAGKGNRARTDINGGGFSTQMAAFRNAAAAQRGAVPTDAQGNAIAGYVAGEGMDATGAQAHLDTTLQEADPGDILAGNTRTIQALAPAMMRNVQRQLANATTVRPDGTRVVDLRHEGLNRALGQVAGIQDNLNRTSPQKAAMFDNLVNGQMLPGDGNGGDLTVMQMVANAAGMAPDSRGIQNFLEVRKEYASARVAQAADAAQPPVEPDHD